MKNLKKLPKGKLPKAPALPPAARGAAKAVMKKKKFNFDDIQEGISTFSDGFSTVTEGVTAFTEGVQAISGIMPQSSGKAKLILLFGHAHIISCILWL